MTGAVLPEMRNRRAKSAEVGVRVGQMTENNRAAQTF
jgi:hypothetical protein